MKKRNAKLILGIILTILLLSVVIYEEIIIPVDSYSIDEGSEGYIYDEYFKLEHPLPPNDYDKLGTDPLGRNVISMLVSGTKTTLGIGFLATTIKFIIAILVVFTINERVRKKIIKTYSIVFNIVVEIIIAFLILRLPWYKELDLKYAIIVYGLVLGIIGWGRLARKIDESNDSIASMIGNGFIELSRVLFIQFVLGIGGITVGVNKFANIETKWGYMPNYNPEWAGMLATVGKALSTRSFWLIIGPSICFIIAIISFLLLGKGILYDVEVDNYKKLKKIALFFSPKEFINQCNNLYRYWGNVVFKSFVVALIIFIIVGQFHINKYKNRYQFDLDIAYKHIEELSKYEGRKTGTLERDKVANYIAEELKKYDISPLFEDEYIQEFDVDGKVKGKNIGGYIWGKNSNNPLVLVTSYDCLGKDNKGLYKNGTSVAATLELARNLIAKSKENMNSRTIVFLFTDGSEENGQGVVEAIGNKNVDVYSFYVYMNYLGLGQSNKLYMDTSTVNSAFDIFYKNIKGIKLRGKELGIPIKQEYLYPAFCDIQNFMEKDVSGVVISSVDTQNIVKQYDGKSQNDLSNINKEKLKEQSQLVLDFAVDYAWISNWHDRGLKANN